MKNRTLVAAGLLVLWTSSSVAAESGPPASRNVAQVQCMRDPASRERLFYDAGEVARLSGLSEAQVLDSIRTGRLAAVRVDGARLVPASAARGFVRRSAERQDRAANDAALENSEICSISR